MKNKNNFYGRLTAFVFTTLNGYFEGPGKGDISWHRHGEEENEFAGQGLESKNILLFGRVTYELMAGYWPTSVAIENNPIVAKRMNNAEKIVFSKTLKKAEWDNTKLIKEDITGEIKNMKETSGKDMTLLGSGSILTLFAEKGLIDEYQVMVDPVVLGSGTPLFKNIQGKLDLELTKTRIFKSGTVLLCYKPLKR